MAKEPPLHARHFELSHGKVILKQPRGEKGKFEPFIEIQLKVAMEMSGERTFARAYFFDKERKPFGRAVGTIPALYGKVEVPSALPMYFNANRWIKVRFQIPKEVIESGEHWSSVVVFGDDLSASACVVASYRMAEDAKQLRFYNFPEQEVCMKEGGARAGVSTEKLVEIRCNPNLDDFKYFTLFFRLPDGVSQGSEAKGVLCLSLVANQLDDVRRSLLDTKARGDIADMIRYADRQKLIVICWASRQLWNPGKNWNDLSAEEAERIDFRMKKTATLGKSA